MDKESDMSEDEKDLICGKMIRKHSEAKKTLACVKEKQAQVGTLLKRVADAWSGGRGIPPTRLVVSDDRLGIHREHEQIDDDIRWPSKDEIIGLVIEEKRLQAEIADLETRLKDLGYGEYAR